MNDENLLRARAAIRRSPKLSPQQLARMSGVTVAKAQQMLAEEGPRGDDEEDEND